MYIDRNQVYTNDYCLRLLRGHHEVSFLTCMLYGWKSCKLSSISCSNKSGWYLSLFSYYGHLFLDKLEWLLLATTDTKSLITFERSLKFVFSILIKYNFYREIVTSECLKIVSSPLRKDSCRINVPMNLNEMSLEIILSLSSNYNQPNIGNKKKSFKAWGVTKKTK
jgi:hypothetical protein